jgi:hypothetical protein
MPKPNQLNQIQKNLSNRRNTTNSRNNKAVVSHKSAPVSKTIITKTTKPMITNRQNGATNIKHREYIADFSVTNSNFNINKYPINPGLNAVFPWLSSVASRFEYYTFHKLKFIYQPICPTTTPGSVMLAVDYDAADPTPNDKIVLMSYAGAMRTSPWTETVFDSSSMDRSNFTTKRFVRQGPVGQNDVKTYDVGNFFLASISTPATPTALGELYVEYDVSFYTPNLIHSQVNIKPYQKIVVTKPVSGPVKVVADILNAVNSPIAWPNNLYSLESDGYLELIAQAAGGYGIQSVLKRAPGSGKGSWSMGTAPNLNTANLEPNNFNSVFKVADDLWGVNARTPGDMGSIYAQPLLWGSGDVDSGSASNATYQVLRLDTSDLTNGMGSGDELTLTFTPLDDGVLSVGRGDRFTFRNIGTDWNFPVIVPPPITSQHIVY